MTKCYDIKKWSILNLIMIIQMKNVFLTPIEFVKSVINFKTDMKKRIKMYTIRKFCLKNILPQLFGG